MLNVERATLYILRKIYFLRVQQHNILFRTIWPDSVSAKCLMIKCLKLNRMKNVKMFPHKNLGWTRNRHGRRPPPSSARKMKHQIILIAKLNVIEKINLWIFPQSEHSSCAQRTDFCVNRLWNISASSTAQVRTDRESARRQYTDKRAENKTYQKI